MTRPLRSGRTLVAWLLGAAVAGCGAKAPPLAPLIIAPERIGQVEVSRLDDYVYVEFEVPSSNTIRDVPADIVWVEVYALTTQPAEGEEEEFSEDWLEAATLVETVLVRPPVLPGMEEPAVEEDEGGPAGEGERAPASQGDEVTVVEPLGPEAFVPVTVGEEEEEEEDEQEDEEVEDEGRPILQPYVAPPFPPPVIRSYVAFGVSSRGREGSASRMESIPLVDPPAPPAAPAVEYTATSIRVTWEAPDTLRLPVQYDGFGPPPGAPAPADDAPVPADDAPASADDAAAPADDAAAPADAAAAPADAAAAPAEVFTGPPLESTPIIEWGEPSRYVVYDVAELGVRPGARPESLGSPQRDEAHSESDVVFGETRCYAVRVLDMVGELEIEGPESPATCIVLTDTFAPAAPSGVIAVADDDAISLVWNANSESDLAGYRVLRGTAPDATLQPLTPEPVERTTYRDARVEPGQRYWYAVQAVDTAVPPNLSPPSTPAAETAR